MSKKPKYYKEALDRLKQERTVDPDLLERNKYRSRKIRAVSKVIKDMDKHTVPEITEELDYPASEIFLAVMHLMKYGGLKLISKRGDYPQYAFGGH